MKLSKLVTFGVLLMATACLAELTHWDPAYFRDINDGFHYRVNWMDSIRGSVKLSEMALPGTHDSGAYTVNVENVVTQCMDFTQQLTYGIRVFDIRIRHYEDRFLLHHDFVYLNLDFDDFLIAVEMFLGRYPSETILFRLREEYTADKNSRSLTETLDAYLKIHGKYLKTNNMGISLWEARGRFIILSDNPQFDDYGLRYRSLDIQDDFHLVTNWDLYGKWEKVRVHLSDAAFGSKDTFYMNYLSGSGGSFPYFVASGRSSPGTHAPRLATGETTPGWNNFPDFPRIDCFFGICTIAFEGTNILTRDRIPNVGGGRTVGIIMADFPGDALINAIIQNNNFPSMKCQ